MCRPAPAAVQTGWCCVPQPRRLIEATPERCTAAKGTYYASAEVARQRCTYGN